MGLNLTKINGSVYLGGNSIFDGSAGSSGPIHVAGGGNIIKGGLGADRFGFDGALAGRADTITIFQHGLDKIELSETIDFPGLGPHGALHPSHFHLGAPVNGHPQIDYFKSTGVLEYYPNGRFGTADHFATLTNHPNVSASDFSLIA